MTKPEILRAARAKIEDPARWTCGVLARDESGRRTDPWSRDAVCWCAAGAVRAITGGRNSGPSGSAGAIYALVQRVPVGHPLGHFNDSHSHAEVLALFDEAIARAEAEAAA